MVLLALNLFAQFSAPFDEMLVVVSTLVRTFCNAAKAIEIQLPLKRCHAT